MTQLEELRKRRELAIKLIQDPTISRNEALVILQCSTRPLYEFMEEEGLEWVRKPHDGSNQFTRNPVITEAQRRKDILTGEVEGVLFTSDVSLWNSKGIYSITSSSGGLYIGKASWSFRKRFHEHKNMLLKGAHHCLGILQPRV